MKLIGAYGTIKYVMQVALGAYFIHQLGRFGAVVFTNFMEYVHHYSSTFINSCST